MTDRCPCRCHSPAINVLLTDKLHAAMACSGCIEDHIVAWTGPLDKPLELPPKDQPFELDDGD